MIDRIVKLLRRETASTEFIPEIDGLRFVSIMMVLLFHIVQLTGEKLSSNSETVASGPLPNMFSLGFQGVQLFFTISGFILALPFMRKHLGLTEKKLRLGKFFLRRLTRLEPPYVLSLLILFALGLYTTRFELWAGVKSLILSVFYVNTIVRPGEFPLINNVTWSLEVEVQFYICAPFLVWLVCRVIDKRVRRLMLLASILAASAASWFIQVQLGVQTWSLAIYLQYFLAGILLCDFYLLENRESRFFDNELFFIFGAVLLCIIVEVDHVTSSSLWLRLLSPLLIFCFYFLVFWNRRWSWIFSLNILTVVGGMCYTIYLLHYAIISTLSHRSIRYLHFENYGLFLLVQIVVMLLAVMAISTLFFVLIEKPCMRKDWPNRLYEFIFSRDTGLRWRLGRVRTKLNT